MPLLFRKPRSFVRYFLKATFFDTLRRKLRSRFSNASNKKRVLGLEYFEHRFVMAGLNDSPEFQNPNNAFDVDGNGTVEVGDALAVANRFASSSSGFIQHNHFYDVDGNGTFDFGDWRSVVVGVNQVIAVANAGTIAGISNLAFNSQSSNSGSRNTVEFSGPQLSNTLSSVGLSFNSSSTLGPTGPIQSTPACDDTGRCDPVAGPSTPSTPSTPFTGSRNR